MPFKRKQKLKIKIITSEYIKEAMCCVKYPTHIAVSFCFVYLYMECQLSNMDINVERCCITISQSQQHT